MKLSAVTAFEAGLKRISRFLALVGGLIMLLLATITVASIIGRTFFGQSVVGDYEITEVGLGIAVFLFLPECYLRNGHIIVDLFTAHCKPKTLHLLDSLAHFIFTFMSVTIAYRMVLSGLESKDYLEQTMILELPIWWVYVAGVISFSICSLCGVTRMLTGQSGENNE